MRASVESATVLVQVACGFARRPQHNDDYRAVSLVDAARAKAVKDRARAGNHIFVTGMVPYEIEYSDRTLANINAARLQSVPSPMIKEVRSVPGLNAFSESWNACKMARDLGAKKIIVVSSDFYFKAYRQMWQAAARRNGLVAEIVEVTHGDLVSDKVWGFYSGVKAQILSRVAASSKLGHYLAKMIADRMTGKRATEGFKIDGHTTIG